MVDMSENEHSGRPAVRSTIAVVIAGVLILIAVAAFGWRHYRSAEGEDPRISIDVPSAAPEIADQPPVNGAAATGSDP